MQRRNVLITMAAAATGASVPLLRAANANAEAAAGAAPDPATHWEAGAANPAMPPRAAGLLFLTTAEAETLGAMADRLIPADELSIGGKEAGCVTFIDRQLDGTSGHGVSDYRLGPYHRGTPELGPQNQLTPAQRYRAGLKALHAYCQQQYGKTYAQLDAATQDAVLTSMEQYKLALGDVEGKPLFELILQTCAKASWPTRSTAATRIWPAGRCWVSPAPLRLPRLHGPEGQEATLHPGQPGQQLALSHVVRIVLQ